MASYRRRRDVWFTTSWRRLICDVLETSVYVVLSTFYLRHLEVAWFTTSWGRLIYDVLKTSVKRRLCCNVVATSPQRRKKWFFLIFDCLKNSGNFKCFCLDFYLGMKFCKLLRLFNFAESEDKKFQPLCNFYFGKSYTGWLKLGFLTLKLSCIHTEAVVRSKLLCKSDVFKSFTEFIRKHLCRSLDLKEQAD